MAEYDWGSEKAWIKLGQPYLFTEKYYNYCKTRHTPIAVIYYDTKTSTPSSRTPPTAVVSSHCRRPKTGSSAAPPKGWRIFAAW